MKTTRSEEFWKIVVFTGIGLLGAATVHAAASRGGEEPLWWLFKILGISYN